jgi:hypothetical protein
LPENEAGYHVFIYMPMYILDLSRSGLPESHKPLNITAQRREGNLIANTKALKGIY